MLILESKICTSRYDTQAFAISKIGSTLNIRQMHKLLEEAKRAKWDVVLAPTPTTTTTQNLKLIKVDDVYGIMRTLLAVVLDAAMMSSLRQRMLFSAEAVNDLRVLGRSNVRCLPQE